MTITSLALFGFGFVAGASSPKVVRERAHSQNYSLLTVVT